MTAALWLEGERPPLPRRERTPLYEQAVAAAVQLRDDLEERERTAVLYRVEELERVLEPEWPVDEWDDSSPDPLPKLEAPAEPTVEFRSVKPPRWSRRWWRENLTWRRQVAGGMSGLVLLASLLGWWNQ